MGDRPIQQRAAEAHSLEIAAQDDGESEQQPWAKHAIIPTAQIQFMRGIRAAAALHPLERVAVDPRA